MDAKVRETVETAVQALDEALGGLINFMMSAPADAAERDPADLRGSHPEGPPGQRTLGGAASRMSQAVDELSGVALGKLLW
jgi:hypothetical protein